MLGQSADDGACAVDQLAPEIVVGASADTAESWLAARGILPGHPPDPRSHLAPRGKLSAVVNGSDDRRGDDRADARQLGEPPARLIRAAEANNRRVELLNPTIEVVQLVQQFAEDRSRQVREGGTGDGGRRLRGRAPRGLWQ